MIQIFLKKKIQFNYNAIYYTKCISNNIFYFKIMQHSYFHRINKQLRFINENRNWRKQLEYNLYIYYFYLKSYDH